MKFIIYALLATMLIQLVIVGINKLHDLEEDRVMVERSAIPLPDSVVHEDPAEWSICSKPHPGEGWKLHMQRLHDKFIPHPVVTYSKISSDMAGNLSILYFSGRENAVHIFKTMDDSVTLWLNLSDTTLHIRVPSENFNKPKHKPRYRH